MGDKVKIKVNIAGRLYPMSVAAPEEEVIRKAGKTINGMIHDFEEKYDIRDKQDALAMCALQFVAKTLTLEKKESNVGEHIQTKLKTLIQQLEEQV